MLRFVRSEVGATSVEYAVMLALIIAVCIATIKSFGSQAGGIWENNQTQLEDVGF